MVFIFILLMLLMLHLVFKPNRWLMPNFVFCLFAIMLMFNYHSHLVP